MDDAWSEYWAAGYSHSCPTTFSTTYYGKSTRRFWRSLITDVSSEDCWLELCCGGGGLIRLLAETSDDISMPRVIGVDLAEVRAPLGRALSHLPATKRSRIQVLEKVNATRMPIEAGSVSVIASQYGFEYVDATGIRRECERVLSPRATLALVLHKERSRLHLVAKAELELIDQALAEGGLLDCCIRAIPFAAASRANAAVGVDAARVRAEYNRAVRMIVGEWLDGPAGECADQLLRSCGNLIAGATPGNVQAAAAQILRIRHAVTRQRERLAALDEAALGVDGIENIEGWLRHIGFSDTFISPLSEDGYEVGWTLISRRNDD